MQPGDRPGYGRRRRPGFPAGFPDFPNPFGDSGLFGSSGFFDDFFSRDPFDDPFFNRPFGSMFGSSGRLFGPGGFTGMGLGGGGLFGRPDGGLFDQRPLQPPQIEGRRGPVIEQLPDDHEETPESNPRDRQQPIVEHPDDDVGSGGATRQLRNQPRQGQHFHSPSNSGYQPNNGYQSFSFQSSSMAYGGSGGSYYTSSSSRRVAPDGLMEEEHFEKDSSGKQTRSTARGLRDKVHTITKKRNATAPETTLETLHNLTPEEASHFDAQWEGHAARSLPGWNRGRSQTLEGGSTWSTYQTAPALLYNEDFRDGNQPPKKQIKN